MPQYDAKGMDPYSAVEKFQLRENPQPFSVAMFGSSVSIWGVLSDLVADELKLPPHDVRKLAESGGLFERGDHPRKRPPASSGTAQRPRGIDVHDIQA